jgi:hypothetical protein
MHLIHEVRPLPGQRSALFKNAPGVFVHGVGRFTLQVNLFFYWNFCSCGKECSGWIILDMFKAL